MTFELVEIRFFLIFFRCQICQNHNYLLIVHRYIFKGKVKQRLPRLVYGWVTITHFVYPSCLRKHDGSGRSKLSSVDFLLSIQVVNGP